MKSSIGFKSNLYPFENPDNGLPLIMEFFRNLDDPKALEYLQQQIDKYGVPPIPQKLLEQMPDDSPIFYSLTPKQQKLREMAIGCVYSPSGDYPWGTLSHSGEVICKCREKACKYYADCTGGKS